MFRTYSRTALLLTLLASAAIVSPAAAEDAQPFRLTPAAAAASQPLPVLSADALRRFPASQYELFLGGEAATSKFAFFAMPEEASVGGRLVLTLQTAISVAPEHSKLLVKINGNEIGVTGLKSGDPRHIEFAVPANIIQPGYNAVQISVDQRHRVDCSIDATYELWTKIDPAASGFVFAGATRARPAMVDLIALAGSANGRTNLRVILPSGAQMGDYDRATRVVQALSVFGNYTHPTVEFATTPGTGPGVDIYLGTRAGLAKLLPGAPANLDGIHVEDAGEPMRKQLILTASDAVALDQRIDDLVAMAVNERPAGTPEGLAALANSKGRQLEPGEKVTLEQLGYTAQRFAGRYSVSNIAFAMPSDFYPGAYAAMNLHLSALYVGGLSPEAVLVVKANGKEVANIPLSSRREGAIRDQRLPIPFSALRPGQNMLQIEARLPSRLDAACESVDKVSSAVRLAISDKSYLEIPSYARIGRYPDIAGLASGLSAKDSAGAERTTALFIPNYERAGLNAAATFVSKMASSSGWIKPFEFTSIMPEAGNGQVIAFGSYSTLPVELTSAMKLDFVNLRQAARPGRKPMSLQVASLETNTMPAQVQSDAPQGTLLTAAFSGASLFSEQAAEFAAAPVEQSRALFDIARLKFVDELSLLDPSHLLPGFGKEEPAFAPLSDAEFVVAQSSFPQGGVWTVVASRDPGQIMADTDVLTSNDIWNTLGGAAQSFSETGVVMDSRMASSQVLFQTEPMTITNMRLVAAGWLGNNAPMYVTALLSAAILLGLGTFFTLRTGRHRPR